MFFNSTHSSKRSPAAFWKRRVAAILQCKTYVISQPQKSSHTRRTNNIKIHRRRSFSASSSITCCHPLMPNFIAFCRRSWCCHIITTSIPTISESFSTLANGYYWSKINATPEPASFPWCDIRIVWNHWCHFLLYFNEPCNIEVGGLPRHATFLFYEYWLECLSWCLSSDKLLLCQGWRRRIEMRMIKRPFLRPWV